MSKMHANGISVLRNARPGVSRPSARNVPKVGHQVNSDCKKKSGKGQVTCAVRPGKREQTQEREELTSDPVEAFLGVFKGDEQEKGLCTAKKRSMPTSAGIHSPATGIIELPPSPDRLITLLKAPAHSGHPGNTASHTQARALVKRAQSDLTSLRGAKDRLRSYHDITLFTEIPA
ncbi:hypothetical protein HPB52_023443 [Rhipicephalus sanguineus]|uniref:Uncharacterized protein n=1 Tax=Rhipicephalus sanguineus TaxID=34632 RepID=A0A9D4Q3U5_RHISA|nr:hypothetical protein HPB52_023443 [Rhipicephalus sanguineus]